MSECACCAFARLCVRERIRKRKYGSRQTTQHSLSAHPCCWVPARRASWVASQPWLVLHVLHCLLLCLGRALLHKAGQQPLERQLQGGGARMCVRMCLCVKGSVRICVPVCVPVCLRAPMHMHAALREQG